MPGFFLFIYLSKILLASDTRKKRKYRPIISPRRYITIKHTGGRRGGLPVETQLRTLPVPGTSRPSTGRGISMLLTWPYLLHSSLTSSTISSYSSSSRSSSGATMFIRHSTSVGRPPIWVTELFIRPGTCSVTGVWFILVWGGHTHTQTHTQTHPESIQWFVLTNRSIEWLCRARDIESVCYETCSLVVSRRPSHQSGVLGSHTGSLDQQLLVSELHAVQPRNGLETQHAFRRGKSTF